MEAHALSRRAHPETPVGSLELSGNLRGTAYRMGPGSGNPAWRLGAVLRGSAGGQWVGRARHQHGYRTRIQHGQRAPAHRLSRRRQRLAGDARARTSLAAEGARTTFSDSGFRPLTGPRAKG